MSALLHRLYSRRAMLLIRADCERRERGRWQYPQVIIPKINVKRSYLPAGPYRNLL